MHVRTSAAGNAFARAAAAAAARSQSPDGKRGAGNAFLNLVAAAKAKAQEPDPPDPVDLIACSEYKTLKASAKAQ